MVKEKTIDPNVRIGHVHLKVANLQRALDFYCGVLGFELTQRYGEEAAFVSAGGYHHHIGLNTWESSRWIATAEGRDRALSFRDFVFNSRRSGRCPETPDAGEHFS